MKHICPVCGYDDLHEPAYYDGEPSFAICPSCYFQFGKDDDDAPHYTFEQYREEWIKKKMPWRRGGQPPANWNPIKQLQNIGINLKS